MERKEKKDEITPSTHNHLAVNCHSCDQNIKKYEFLTCSLCKNSYHIECINVSFGRFRIMSPNRKKTYRCDTCIEGLKIIPEQNFITHRNKLKINIPTENSFEELSDDLDEFSSLTSSPAMTINTSLSMQRLSSDSEIENLKQQNQTLRRKLEISDSEIEHLLEENKAMNKRIMELELKVKKLSHDCTCYCGKSCCTKCKEKAKNKLDFTHTENSSPKSKPGTTELDITLKQDHHYKSTIKPCDTKKIDPNDETKTRKIYILGDEQLKDLSATIIKARQGKWNNKYQPIAHILTGATSTEILDFCTGWSKDISENDVIVLGFGSNDRDVHRLHSNICIILNQLSKNVVYCAPINCNPGLNVKTLNDNLKLWTKHFDNCTNIDMKRFNLSHKSYVNHLCDKINAGIDYIEYKVKYLTIKSLKQHILRPAPKKTNLNNHQTQKYKKGTIPYYFNKNRLSKAPPSALNSQNNTSIPKQGSQNDCNNSSSKHDFFRESK